MGIIANLLFGDNSDKTSYKDAAYAKRLSEITGQTFDLANKDNKEYIDKNYDGGYDAYKLNYLNSYENAAKDSMDKYNASKNNYFGNGMIGAMLNPWAQVATGVTDLAGMGLSGGKYNAWDKTKDPIGASRDIMSDIGALGESAFDLAGMGALGDAVKGGTKLTANIGKTALRTGALGAGENAFAALREGGSNTNLGDVATNAAIGGVIGGGLGGISQLAGNAKAISNLSPSKELMRVSGNAIQTPQYQEALKTLGLTGQDVTSDAINRARKQAMKNTAKTVGYETAEGQAQRMAINNAYQTLLDNANGKATQAVANARPVKLPFAQRMANLKAYMANNPSTSKFGQTTRNLLNSKAGKIGAGVGGGLLLSKLLFGGGGNANQEMSDAELEQLLNNYYNNGGTYGY